MHDIEIQKRFVQLRVEGKSFAQIANTLGVSRRTLIDWSRKYQFEIQNQKAIALEALREELVASRETRLRTLAAQLRQIEDELNKRNLAELSTGKLFALAQTLRRQIERETGEVQFISPVKEIPAEEFCEEAQKWPA
jgi:transposase